MMRSAGISAVVAVAIASCAFASANAAGAARSGVTIHYKKRVSLYGFVFSPHPGRCADERRVSVFKQKGKRQIKDPDRRMNYHSFRTRRTPGGRYRWQLNNPRRQVTTGRYFAFIGSTNGCQSDYSKTIHITVPRPDTKITGITIHHQAHRVRFHYEATGGIKPYRFRCHLDTERRHCDADGTATFDDVSPGHHVLEVKALGRDGLEDASPAHRGFEM
jgi:hypothetical protein